MTGQRLSSGLPVGEAVALAACWWQDTARHLMRNPELRDPDLGIDSGLLRGLPWDDLTREAKISVVKVWHEQFGAQAAARAGQGVGRRGLVVPQ